MYPTLLPNAIGLQVTLAAGLDLASRHGFTGYHADIKELAKLGTMQASELAQEKDVKLAAFSFPLEFRKDEAVFEKGLNALPGLAKVAAELGISRTSTWVMPFSNELTYQQNFKLHASRLKPAAAILADHGVRLGLEYVGPKTLWSSGRFPFIHTMREMMELVEAVGANAGFLLDSFHWFTAQETVEDITQLSPEQIIEVHVNDAQNLPPDAQLDQVRTLPGESGVIDLKSFMQALGATSYDGPVMVEPFSQRVRDLAPEEACAETAASLKGVLRYAER